MNLWFLSPIDINVGRGACAGQHVKNMLFWNNFKLVSLAPCPEQMAEDTVNCFPRQRKAAVK